MKKLLLFTAITTLIGAASAVQLTPGQDNLVTNQSTNFSNAETNLALTFKDNSTGVYAKPPKDFPPETGTITLNYENRTEEIEAEVIPYSNWTVQTNQTTSTASVGSSGTLTELKFTQNGNVQSNLEINASGNLSQYLGLNNEFTVYPQNTITKTVAYSIPSDTDFGVYNASLFINGSEGLNQTVNFSTTFEDNIPPEITSVNTPDLMSTKETEFSFEAGDNLNISSNSFEVWREVEVDQGNQTFVENQTVDTYSFDKVENTDEYVLNFTDTDVIDNYYYNLSVTDKSNNTASREGSFKVQGLDAVNVLDSNFEFESVYPRNEDNVVGSADNTADKQILELTEETDVELQLRNFSHGDDNSSIEIGVLKPGDEVKTEFDGEGSTITVSDEGVYSLVVDADKVEDYSGVIGVSTVPQHVEISNEIRFEGLVNNPEYPPEQSWSLRGWNASLEYVDVDDDPEPDVMRRVLEGDADRCKGFSSAEECPELKDVENIVENVKDENERLSQAKNTAQFLMFVSWGGLLFFIATVFFNRYGAGVFEVEKRIHRPKIGQQVNSIDEIEV